MKFFNVLTLASFALANPVVKERQDNTVAGSVLSIVNTLQGTVSTSLDNIEILAGNINDATDPQFIIDFVGIVRQRLEDILDGLTDAADGLVDATTGALATSATIIQNLTLAQIQQVVAALAALREALEGIDAVLDIDFQDLTPDLQAIINEEIDAIQAAIAGVVNPLVIFANAVRQKAPVLSVAVSGIDNAINILGGVVTNLVNSLGLSNINLGALFGGLPRLSVPVAAPAAPAGLPRPLRPLL